jgi:hypothetical protein
MCAAEQLLLFAAFGLFAWTLQKSPGKIPPLAS